MGNRRIVSIIASTSTIFIVACLFQNCAGYSAMKSVAPSALLGQPTSGSQISGLAGTDPATSAGANSGAINGSGSNTAGDAGLNTGALPTSGANNNALKISVSPDATVFTAQTSVTLQATGGTAPYKFRVNGSTIATNEFTTPNTEGNIQLEVEDANGLKGSYQIRNTSQAVTTSPYYNGGSIMLGEIHVYLIWYGDWTYNSGAKDIVENYVTNLGGSDYYSIVTSYFGSQGAYASNKLSFLKSAAVPSTGYGTSLTNGTIQQIVADKIKDGTFPADESAIYAIMMNKNVDIQLGDKKFCSQGGLSGGYHQNFKMATNGKMIKYAMIGDVTGKFCSQLLNRSTEQSPNNNPSADFMSSVMGHELTEAVTNPLDYRSANAPAPTAWDAKNEGTGEIGDLCAGYNGVPKTMVKLGSRSYWLQQLMVVKGNTADHCSDSINR